MVRAFCSAATSQAQLGPPAGRGAAPAPCKGFHPLTLLGQCCWSVPLRGSRGVTDAPRRGCAATPRGVERPPCRHGGTRPYWFAALGKKSCALLLCALWLASVSKAHRVLASPNLVFSFDVVRGSPHLRWGTGVTMALWQRSLTLLPYRRSSHFQKFQWISMGTFFVPGMRLPTSMRSISVSTTSRVR